MISVLDYGIGNIGSVINALKFIKSDFKVISSPEEIISSEKLIVPGVSAFGSAMRNIEKLKLDEAIKEFVKTGKYLLGICVGIQLFFETSEESFGVKGLCLFKGAVKKFSEPDLVVPHMGWNTIKFAQKRSKLFDGIEDNSYFYFVHSYYPSPENKDVIIGNTEYGKTDFCSAIEKENIAAFQFHPEKSQKNGLTVLKNFNELQ